MHEKCIRACATSRPAAARAACGASPGFGVAAQHHGRGHAFKRSWFHSFQRFTCLRLRRFSPIFCLFFALSQRQRLLAGQRPGVSPGNRVTFVPATLCWLRFQKGSFTLAWRATHRAWQCAWRPKRALFAYPPRNPAVHCASAPREPPRRVRGALQPGLAAVLRGAAWLVQQRWPALPEKNTPRTDGA